MLKAGKSFCWKTEASAKKWLNGESRTVNNKVGIKVIPEQNVSRWKFYQVRRCQIFGRALSRFYSTLRFVFVVAVKTKISKSWKQILDMAAKSMAVRTWLKPPLNYEREKSKALGQLS